MHYTSFEKYRGEFDGKDDALLKVVSQIMKSGEGIVDDLTAITDVQLEVFMRNLHEKLDVRRKWNNDYYNKIYGSTAIIEKYDNG